MARTALIARRGFLGIVAGLLAVGGTRRSVSVAAAHPAATPDRQAASLGRVAMRSAQDRAVLSETTRMAAGSPLEELLRFIPDTSAHRRYLTLSDVELAARRVGAQPPPDHADQTAVYAYARALFDVGMLGGPFISGLGEDIAVEPSRRPYLAFGVGNVSQTALTGTPPRQTELIFGRFDPSATDAALSACADCTPPARETHQGVPFYAWGNDFEQDFSGRFKPPAHDALGGWVTGPRGAESRAASRPKGGGGRRRRVRKRESVGPDPGGLVRAGDDGRWVWSGWYADQAAAGAGRADGSGQTRSSLPRLWARHAKRYSPAARASPRRLRVVKPRASLSWPKTGSTTVLRRA
jgi:hypothetical protein